jgi:hypothetical protein
VAEAAALARRELSARHTPCNDAPSMPSVLVARLAADRTAKQALVLQACQRLDVVPSFERGLEGVYVFDQQGKRLATIRYVPHQSETCAVVLDVRCERLQAAMRRPAQLELSV